MLRWLTIAWAGLAAATLVLTREAYHVGVGGYTRGDDRHPRQVARRIAALEHAAFPTENLKHDGDACRACDPEARKHHRLYAINITSRPWLCALCDETGAGSSTLGTHWEATGHDRFDIYAQWDDAYRARHLRHGTDVSYLRGEAVVPPVDTYTVPPLS